MTEYLTFKKIEALDYSFPEGFDEQAQDIVKKILARGIFIKSITTSDELSFVQILDPAERLGATPKYSPSALRNHPFFIGPPPSETISDSSYIHWDTLWTIPPPSLEVGLFKAPPPPQEEAALAGGMQWNDFVNQFSLVGEGDEPEDELTYSEKPVNDTSGEATLQPSELVQKFESMHLSPRQPSMLDRLPSQVVDEECAEESQPGAEPMNGNSALLNDIPWSTVLQSSESIEMASRVEVKAGKLLFQRTEQRTLALTSKRRLICVKVKHNSAGQGSLVIKQDFLLLKNGAEASSTSNSANVVIGLKGEKTLVVDSVSHSHLNITSTGLRCSHAG
jgi:3-phosphoinositide dependent protein kinase-1